MTFMTSNDIRQAFIDFFVLKHGHTFVPSSPVVPLDDPTLLFTNAGMNQFKPIFLGTEKRAYSRAVNTQKCIRAGGKHNDLDDVGRSRRHHTFFEMLGNWSFGDYFKEGAIKMAWELLVDVWKLDPTRLHVTVHDGDESNGVPRDEEAADIWHKMIGVPRAQIHYGGKDNFWEMGETGPCGPFAEVFYDRTPAKSGGKTVLSGEDARVMEIWNNVFIQYNRNADRSLSKLPSQHVDTGMGFERICQVIQGKNDNYAIDLFDPIFAKITELSGQQYGGLFPASDTGDRSTESPELKRDIAFRVIADHARMATFSITDGAKPDNKGRDSVVRSVIRRAVRFGYQEFGLRQPFMYEIVHVLAECMGDFFPELRKDPKRVAAIIESEERSFLATIERGLKLFNEAISRKQDGTLLAVDSFDLHTTFGFPIDLQDQMALESGVRVDRTGYQKLFEAFQKKSGEGRKSHVVVAVDLTNLPKSIDTPKYGSLESTGRIIGAIVGNQVLLDGRIQDSSATEEAEWAILLDQTNFYGEQGGQVGDTGTIVTASGSFEVASTERRGDHVLHIGRLTSGTMDVGQTATLTVAANRNRTEENHTSTHIANWALREVLGDDVQQKGSLVDPAKLRFDFSHGAPLSLDQAKRVERLVNDAIKQDLIVDAQEVPQADALKINGLRAVFGEKYPPMVRVVSIGALVNDLVADPSNAKWRQFSIEFCGGTHLKTSSQARAFVLASDDAVSKGIRRIVAFTGDQAASSQKLAQELASEVEGARIAPDNLLQSKIQVIQKLTASDGVPFIAKRLAQAAVAELQAKQKAFEKSQKKQSGFDGRAISEQLVQQAAGPTVVGHVAGASSDDLRSVMDGIRKAMPSYAMFLTAIDGDKLSYAAAVSDDLIAQEFNAGDWLKEVAKVVGGTGGGRPQTAQGAVKDVTKVNDTLNAAREIAARFPLS